MLAERPCPICRKAVQPRAENPAFPFCAERCKLIDLGNWLNESYRIDAGVADGETPSREEDE